MGRAKGCTKTGGRKKGTPNRVQADLKRLLNDFLNDERERMQNDWLKLAPPQRAELYCKLLSYVVPKQQAVSVEAMVEAEYKQIKELMDNLPDEAISRIAKKLLELNEKQ